MLTDDLHDTRTEIARLRRAMLTIANGLNEWVESSNIAPEESIRPLAPMEAVVQLRRAARQAPPGGEETR